MCCQPQVMWKMLFHRLHINMMPFIIMLELSHITYMILNVLNQSPTSKIGYQHSKVVTNTFRLQHPSPTSM